MLLLKHKIVVQAAAAKGEAPPGLPLKGAGQDSSDAQPRVNIGVTENLFIFLSLFLFLKLCKSPIG